MYDEKRRKVELGDVVIFKKLNSKGEIKVRVKGLLRFRSFRDLFMFVPKKYLAHESLSLREQIERMREYYSEDEERKYGVLGIWFERLNNRLFSGFFPVDYKNNRKYCQNCTEY